MPTAPAAVLKSCHAAVTALAFVPCASQHVADQHVETLMVGFEDGALHAYQLAVHGQEATLMEVRYWL